MAERNWIAAEIVKRSWREAHPRTVDLWNIYTAPESLLERGRWIDIASESIPRHYAGTGVVTAEMLARRGDTAGSQSVMNVVQRIVDIVNPTGQ